MATTLLLKRLFSSKSKAMNVFNEEVKQIYRTAGVSPGKVLVIGEDTFDFSKQLALLRKSGSGLLTSRPVGIADQSMKSDMIRANIKTIKEMGGTVIPSVSPTNMDSHVEVEKFSPQGFNAAILYHPWSMDEVRDFVVTAKNICVPSAGDIDLSFIRAKEAQLHYQALVELGQAHGLIVDEFGTPMGRHLLIRYQCC